MTYIEFLTTGVISNSKDDEDKVSLWKLFNDDLFAAKLKLADILSITDFLFCALCDLQVQNIEDYERVHTLANVIDCFTKDAIKRIEKVMKTPLKNIVI